MQTGDNILDERRAYIHLGVAQSLLDKPSAISYILVKMRDPERAPQLAARLETLLQHRARSWQERAHGNLQIFRAVRISAGITVSAIIMLAGFGIFNVLTLMIIDKVREIAILRSMGYQRRDISAIFLWQGFLVAAAGSVLGCALGFGDDLRRVPSADAHSRFLCGGPFPGALESGPLFRGGGDCVCRGVAGELPPGAARGTTGAGSHPAGGRPMTEKPPLVCAGLQRWLGEDEARVHVLRGVSLEVPAGSVQAIVGPSGCGKSTLLYLLGLLDSADEGRIWIGGAEVSGLPDPELTRKRNELIGFVFQFHFLMHEFTAEENVMIPMRRLGKWNLAAMRERAGALLDLVGLADKRARISSHLSGGEQQRVAIARALANDPPIVLADEPTGNLDTANSERVFALLTALVKRENKALVLVTHNPLIAQASDWVHEMKDGAFIRTYSNLK